MTSSRDSRVLKVNTLLAAASDLRLGRVRELLDDGVDPNSTDPWGRTALQLAVRHAHLNESDALALVRLLLAAGADVNAADADGNTPLSHAAIYAYHDLLAHLIAEGADVNRRNPQGQTIISEIESMPVLRGRRRRVIKALERAGGVR